jgi:hypothetical protein
MMQAALETMKWPVPERTNTSCLYEHLLKFGLTMHIGTGATPSNTEAMYFSQPRRRYSDAEIQKLGVLDYLGSPLKFIDLTTEFKFLGLIVHHSLTSDADVENSIRSASAAFGAVKNKRTNKTLISKSKEAALCLNILLYGSKIWLLTGRSVQSPSSLPSPMRSNHVPHYHRSHNSPPYFICQPL